MPAKRKTTFLAGSRNCCDIRIGPSALHKSASRRAEAQRGGAHMSAETINEERRVGGGEA